MESRLSVVKSFVPSMIMFLLYGISQLLVVIANQVGILQRDLAWINSLPIINLISSVFMIWGISFLLATKEKIANKYVIYLIITGEIFIAFYLLFYSIKDELSITQGTLGMLWGNFMSITFLYLIIRINKLLSYSKNIVGNKILVISFLLRYASFVFPYFAGWFLKFSSIILFLFPLLLTINQYSNLKGIIREAGIQGSKLLIPFRTVEKKWLFIFSMMGFTIFLAHLTSTMVTKKNMEQTVMGIGSDDPNMLRESIIEGTKSVISKKFSDLLKMKYRTAIIERYGYIKSDSKYLDIIRVGCANSDPNLCMLKNFHLLNEDVEAGIQAIRKLCMKYLMKPCYDGIMYPDETFNEFYCTMGDGSYCQPNYANESYCLRLKSVKLCKQYLETNKNLSETDKARMLAISEKREEFYKAYQYFYSEEGKPREAIPREPSTKITKWKDPWGTDIKLVNNVVSDLWITAGQDGKFDTDDDIQLVTNFLLVYEAFMEK